MSPVEASKISNESKVYENLYRQIEINYSKPKFKIGDKVRINKYKNVFAKGYIGNYTEEIFSISKVLNTTPVTYKIEDF